MLLGLATPVWAEGPRMQGRTTYNAAADLVERNLAAGRGAKPAFIDDRGQYSYAEIAGRVSRFANVLRRLGMQPEQRILLCLHDTIDFPTAFLGAIRAGVVPVPVNTQLLPEELAFMLADSRARAVIVSAPVLPVMTAALALLPEPRPAVIVSGGEAGERDFAALLAAASATSDTAPTHPDEPCFWLYSSGSTGRPKGTVHIHSSLMGTAELYAIPVLGIAESDVTFSAAKLFFAYGLGNGLTFPMAVGATSVLMAERPTPAAVGRVLRQHRATIFYGVPTLYVAMLASNDLPRPEELALRCCVSAGEPLPPEIGRRWPAGVGVGYYVYCGRSDDMLKVSGMYVSPAEVEAALIAHEDVLEAAVVGVPDEDGLIKPKAFVVAKPGTRADNESAGPLERHAKAMLAPFKCPRSIAFLDELPKTATGKIQRFKLRETSS